MLFVRSHHRESNREFRSFTFAGTLGPRSAAMQFDEMPDNCETETKPTIDSRRRSIRLAKTIEDVWQKVRPDADAGIAYPDLHVRIDPLQRDLDQPAFVRKLHAIRQQVP